MFTYFFFQNNCIHNHNEQARVDKILALPSRTGGQGDQSVASASSMRAYTLVVALLPAGTVAYAPLRAPVSRRPSPASVCMMMNGYGPPGPPNTGMMNGYGGQGPSGLEEERVESAKACAIAAVSGFFASIPALSVSHQITKFAMSPVQWQFTEGMYLVELALFGACYRTIVRSDDNGPLRQGAVGAFALCRALASLPVSSTWTPQLSSQVRSLELDPLPL